MLEKLCWNIDSHQATLSGWNNQLYPLLYLTCIARPKHSLGLLLAAFDVASGEFLTIVSLFLLSLTECHPMDSWKSQRLACKGTASSQNCTVHGATTELAFHRWPGSRAGKSTAKMVVLQEPLCWKLSMLSSLRRVPRIRPSACPCKTSTRLEVRAVLLWAVATVPASIWQGW